MLLQSFQSESQQTIRELNDLQLALQTLFSSKEQIERSKKKVKSSLKKIEQMCLAIESSVESHFNQITSRVIVRFTVSHSILFSNFDLISRACKNYQMKNCL